MKLFKKILVGVTALGSLTGLAGIIAYKTTHNFQPSFYNYKSYMSTDNIEFIGESFEYKEFDSLQQFTRSLTDNKAIAGIGSDFQAAELAKNGIIGKIDYSVLFNDPSLKNNPDKTKKYLQLILHPLVWKHLEGYDDYLKYDNEGNEVNLHLWEFYFPYFMQDAVIAYNVAKNPVPQENATEDGSIDFEKYRTTYKDKLYDMSTILTILSQNGFNYWNITDAVRDNMIYGSTYWTAPEKGGDEEINRHSGAVTHFTYAKLIDSFVNLIQENTSLKLSDTDHINFIGDGLAIVNNLIHPALNVNVAIMYNGDAIDSYYGADNVDGVKDGDIRVIRPKGNLLLTDGFVISSQISEQKAQEVTISVRESIYQRVPELVKIIETFDQENFLGEITQEKIDLIKEKTLALTWKDLQSIYLEKYFENSSYLKANLATFMELLHNKVDLSKPQNQQVLERFYFEEENEDQSDFHINPYPYIIKEYLNEQFGEILDNTSEKVVSLYKQDQNINKLKEILVSYIKSNSFSDYIFAILVREIEKWSNEDYFTEEIYSSVENTKDFLLDLVSWKLALVDISSDELADEISQNWRNLQNYDYVNYDATLINEYEFIRRNYFADFLDKVDQIALQIYDIDIKDGIDRVDIKPIDNKLRSLVNDYYYKRTKG
ncbi:hypothetical protein [Mycoplasmopsis columboralis]|uniref:Uncharacterized protein n=1 Tax=Mycoplasmopsis columboralis TaxID=171282 RepID=A0A449B5K0_9BACT|nr:hypothetical protein [Mycoplasmopsis columboralis]VEU75884.1 Uncharacterised protein [Mycoplasmopsis columboralis]